MVMIWMMMMMVMMIGPCLVWQTSDEAVSDLSSLSDDSANDRHAFEDQIAQAVVSKVGTVFTQLTQSSSTPGEHKGVNKAPPPRPVLGNHRSSFRVFPLSSISASIVHPQAPKGLPLPLFPGGAHVSAACGPSSCEVHGRAIPNASSSPL